MSFTSEFARAQRIDDAKADSLDGTFEYRLNKRLSDAAKSWALENPWQVARLAIIKIGRTWRPWPTADETSGRLLAIVSATGFFLVMVPAMIGVWRYRSRRWEVGFLLMPAIYFTCLHAVFIGSMRYRLPAVLVLTILAAPVLASWLERLSNRREMRTQP